MSLWLCGTNHGLEVEEGTELRAVVLRLEPASVTPWVCKTTGPWTRSQSSRFRHWAGAGGFAFLVCSPLLPLLWSHTLRTTGSVVKSPGPCIGGVKVVGHWHRQTAERGLGYPTLPGGNTPAGRRGVTTGKLSRLRAAPACAGLKQNSLNYPHYVYDENT